MTTSVGDALPVFELRDQDNQTFRVDDVRGKPLVLFFYPKDETAVCTAEACSFRDAYSDFVALGADVVGISSDDVSSHGSFANKHRLPYRLLADVDGRVRRLLGVPGALFGLGSGRVTYVVDRDGTVRHIHKGLLQSQQHVDEAITALRALVKQA